MAFFGKTEDGRSIPLTTSRAPRPGDTAMLLRNERGQAQRMRFISETKLPRMTNSERGKFYRQKYYEYDVQLSRDVQLLQGQVHNLQRLQETRQILPFRYPGIGSDEVQAAIQVVHDALIRCQGGSGPLHQSASTALAVAALELTQATRRSRSCERQELCSSQVDRFIAKHENTSSPLVFKLDSIEIEGYSDSRIVVARGWLCVQYRPLELGALFPAVRRNKHLAARLLTEGVTYNCTYRFHVAPSHALAFVSVEADVVSGLLELIPNPACVDALLGSMFPPESGAKAKPQATEMITNARNGVHSPALSDVDVHPDISHAEKHASTPLTPPRRSMALHAIHECGIETSDARR